jgi:hypothetical protein
MWSGGMGIINNRTCSFDMGRWDDGTGAMTVRIITSGEQTTFDLCWHLIG